MASGWPLMVILMLFITMHTISHYRHRDIIYELASVGDLPLPNSTPLYSNKRERDTDSPASTRTSDAIPSSLLSPNTTRSIVGSGRVKENIRQSFLNAEPAEPWGAYSLPVYSEELGRLPVHGEFLPQGQPPLTGSPSYLNHVTQQDVITLDSLFSTDGLMFDPVGSNYDALGTDFLSSSGSSLDTKLSGLHSAEADLHPGEGIPNLANAQPMIDNDAIAMWSNAPSGFEYVIYSTPSILVFNSFLQARQMGDLPQ